VLFLTAVLLGTCAGLLRSAFSIALVAVLIVIAFVGAGAISGGLWPFGRLGAALIGYNVGLINLIAGLFVAQRLRLI
jgi:uncharacterized membrane protein